MSDAPPVIGKPPPAASRPAPKPAHKTPAPPQPGARVFLVRLTMLCIVIASAALVWWSVTQRLLPASRELRDKTMEMARLANEVQQLEMNWDAEEVERTENRYIQAQSLLFPDADGFLQWQEETERQAAGLALKPASEPGDPQVRSAGGRNLALIPMTLTIDPLEIVRTTNTPYKRLLTFNRLFENPDKRVDLVALSISGNSNSVRHATLVFEGWAGEKVDLP